MSIDISALDPKVLSAVRQNLGCDDPDDETFDIDISLMSPSEVFTNYLGWKGMFGTPESIWNAVHSITRASSKQKEKWMAKFDYKKLVKDGMDKIKEKDVRRAAKVGAKARHKANQGVLKQLVVRIHEIALMIEDYANNKCRDLIPWWSVSAAVMMILYIVNPLDLIPDCIPILGLIDDLAVATIVLAMIGEDIKRWREWRKEYDKAEKLKSD